MRGDPGRTPDPYPVTRAEGYGRVAALTFDDGPNGACTERLLDVLGRLGVRATFCLVGSQVVAPGGDRVVRRIAEEGHLLANHGWSYDDVADWPQERVEEDLLRTNAAIRQAAGPGAPPVAWFRAANGSWGASGSVALRLGMRPLGVVNTIGDWLTQDLPTLESALRRAVRPGEVVVAHDGGGDRTGTVSAVENVLPELLSEGWRFTFPEGSVVP